MPQFLKDLWSDSLKDLVKEAFKMLIAALPGGITSFISDNTTLITIITLLGFALAYVVFHRAKFKHTVRNIGIVDLYEPKALSTADALKKAITTCDFLGVSAKSTADSREVAAQFERLSLASSKHKIRFLIMNPDAQKAISKRARDEQVNPQAWPNDMQGAIINLKTLTDKKNIDIEIRLYDSYPLWRMVIIDNQCVYLNYALPARKINSSHLIKLDHSKNSLAHTFIKLYENMWEDSLPVEDWLESHQITI
jgi:hypothetical protein